MRHSQKITEQVRSMMAPANPLPGRATEPGWASPPGAEIYRQVIAQPADDTPGAFGYAPGPRRSSSPGRRAAPRSAAGLRRGLASAAAVIAVLAVIGGLTLAARGPAGRPATGGTAGRPPFYVTLIGGLARYVAQVRSTRTGQTLSSVRLPDNSGFETAQVAGSPDAASRAAHRPSGCGGSRAGLPRRRDARIVLVAQSYRLCQVAWLAAAPEPTAGWVSCGHIAGSRQHLSGQAEA
jgi:hypothetical protein